MKTIQGGYVYIISNKYRTVFYVGFAIDIKKRTWEHKTSKKGFTYKYNCNQLLYYQSYHDMDEALGVETKMKRWRNQWKINIIKQFNPEMIDLSDGWYK